MDLVTPRRRRREFGAIRKRASGRYQASYLDPRGMRRVAPNTFATKVDAQVWLSVKESELHRGVWQDPALGKIPLSEYGDRWIEEHRLADRTRDLYRGLFRLHIKPYLGDKELEAIKPETVRWWSATLRDDGRSAQTAAKAYRLLRAILNGALDDGRIAKSPCRLKGADKERPAERPVATVAEVFALADKVTPTYRVFVLTAALASLRWGELLGLRRRDIDLDGGLIHVRQAVTERGGQVTVALPKNERTRIVAIPTVLVDEMHTHLDEQVGAAMDAPVFTSERGGTPRRGNWRAVSRWPQAVQAAGLPEGFHFHDLRHTGNHLAAQTGASTRELMQRMGHSTVRAAMIYQHATEARSRQLADRLDALIRDQQKKDS